MKSVSYAITICNELEEFKNLFNIINNNKSVDDEIIILFDTYNGTNEVHEYLDTLENVKIIKDHSFNGHFDIWKNKINQHSNCDYIFQLDADEFIGDEFIKVLNKFLELNENIDLFYLPRINIVKGITKKHFEKWNWHYTKTDVFKSEKICKEDDEEYLTLKDYGLIIREEKTNDLVYIQYFVPLINFPDIQGRIYKKHLKWVGKIHEKIDGADNFTILPQQLEFCIIHIKNIEKQEKQNKLYDDIERNI